MTVLQAVGWYLPRSVGGTELYVAALAGELSARGVATTIAVPDPEVGRLTEEEVEGVPVVRYPIPRQPTRAEARGEVVARGEEALHALIARLRPTVFHAHTFVTGLGLQAVAAARRVASRIVVTTHSSRLGFHCQRGTLMYRGRSACDGRVEARRCAACALEARGLPQPAADLVAGLPTWAARAADRLPTRIGSMLGARAQIEANQARQARLYQLVDRFVVLTRQARDLLLAEGAPPETVALVPLGIRATPLVTPSLIEASTAPWAANDRPLRLGYVGRFEDVKGVADLLRAFALLPSQARVELSLRGPASAAERAALAPLLGDPRLRLEGALGPSEVAAHLAGLDVLICPSRCHEGGPTIALEAHAVGTPVIGTRGSGFADALVDASDERLVAPGDVAGLAALLARVLESPGPTLARWRAAIPPVRTMAQVTDDYLELYRA